MNPQDLPTRKSQARGAHNERMRCSLCAGIHPEATCGRGRSLLAEWSAVLVDQADRLGLSTEARVDFFRRMGA